MLSKRDSASLEIAPPETTGTGLTDDYAREWDRLNPPSDISIADYSEHSDQKDSHAARIQRQILEDQDFCQKRPRKRGRKRITRQAEDDPYEGEDELDEPQAKFVLPQMDPSRHSTYSDQFTVSDHDDECLHTGRYGNRPVGIVPPYTPPRSFSQPQYIPNYSQEGQKATRYQTDEF